MSRLSRYWRYGALGLLGSGIVLGVVAGWASLGAVDTGAGSDFAMALFRLAETLCAIGAIVWLCPTIVSVSSDVGKLWKNSKAGAILTFLAAAYFAFRLHHFTGPHFYGWYADAWLFFCSALFLGVYLLVKISVALTGAGRG
jgi:hypothetical protein